MQASPYCRAEATYTFAEKKPFVPVRVERDYKADGWLGLIVNLELYFDASSDELFDACIDKLVQSVQRKRRLPANSSATATASIERCAPIFRFSPHSEKDFGAFGFRLFD